MPPSIREKEFSRRVFLKGVAGTAMAVVGEKVTKPWSWPFRSREQGEIFPDTQPIELILSEPSRVFPNNESDERYAWLVRTTGGIVVTAQTYHPEATGANHRDVVAALIRPGTDNPNPVQTDILRKMGGDYRYPFTAAAPNGEWPSTVVVGPDGRLQLFLITPEGGFGTPIIIPPVMEGAEVVRAAHALDDKGEKEKKIVVAAEEFYYALDGGVVVLRRLVTAQRVHLGDSASQTDGSSYSSITDRRIFAEYQGRYDLREILRNLGLPPEKVNHLLDNQTELSKMLSIKYMTEQGADGDEGYYATLTDGNGNGQVLTDGNGNGQGRIKIAAGSHPRVVFSPKSKEEGFFVFAATPDDNIVGYRFGGDYDNGTPLTGYRDKFPFEVVGLANGMIACFWRERRQSGAQRIMCRLLNPEGRPIGEPVEVAQPAFPSYLLGLPHAASLPDTGIVLTYSQGESFTDQHLSLNYLEFDPDGKLRANRRVVYLTQQGNPVLLTASEGRVVALGQNNPPAAGAGDQPSEGEVRAGEPFLGLVVGNQSSEEKPQPQQYNWRTLYLSPQGFSL